MYVREWLSIFAINRLNCVVLIFQQQLCTSRSGFERIEHNTEMKTIYFSPTLLFNHVIILGNTNIFSSAISRSVHNVIVKERWQKERSCLSYNVKLMYKSQSILYFYTSNACWFLQYSKHIILKLLLDKFVKCIELASY